MIGGRAQGSTGASESSVMLIDAFQQWAAQAPAQARAEAAQALVAAYSDVGRDRVRADRLDRMVAILLDDSCLVVRRALAEAAARSVDVPRCVLVALAHDDAIVSTPVLAGSPLLSEADLVEAIGGGDGEAQLAVASRAGVPTPVMAALADTGTREVALALLCNPTVSPPPRVLRSLLQRFRDDADVREALLAHAHRDPALHHELVLAGSESLTRFAVACGWMSTSRADALRRDSHDRSVVSIAAHCHASTGAAGPRALADHLRTAARLTPALLLRALLSGDIVFCEAALSLLSGVPRARVKGHMGAPRSLGFASLYAKAGLPPRLLPVFRAALAAVPPGHSDGPTLSRVAVRRVLRACLALDGGDLGHVLALLHRLEAEALRDDVRAVAPDEAEPRRHPVALDLSAARAALASPRHALRAA